jgi:hypothetical protein
MVPFIGIYSFVTGSAAPYWALASSSLVLRQGNPPHIDSANENCVFVVIGVGSFVHLPLPLISLSLFHGL